MHGVPVGSRILRGNCRGSADGGNRAMQGGHRAWNPSTWESREIHWCPAARGPGSIPHVCECGSPSHSALVEATLAKVWCWPTAAESRSPMADCRQASTSQCRAALEPHWKPERNTDKAGFHIRNWIHQLRLRWWGIRRHETRSKMSDSITYFTPLVCAGSEFIQFAPR